MTRSFNTGHVADKKLTWGVAPHSPLRVLKSVVARLEKVRGIGSPFRQNKRLAHENNAKWYHVGYFAILLNANVNSMRKELRAIAIERRARIHCAEVVAVLPQLIGSVKAWRKSFELLNVEHGCFGYFQFFKVRLMHFVSCIVPPCDESIKVKTLKVHRKHAELNAQ